MTTVGPTVHVIGGGLAGLVSAVVAAEGGAPVIVHEAGREVGGRAQSGDGPFGVNLGPHVLLTDGAVHRWLQERGMVPALRRPSVTRNVIIADGSVRRLPSLGLTSRALTWWRTDAPVDDAFVPWAASWMPELDARLLARWAGLVTFHHDPAVLSARFVWDRIRRAIARPDHVRSVAGGWSELVGTIARRAEERSVRFELGEPMTPADLPHDGPVIVATGLPVASHLLGEELTWTGARTALLDVALAEGGRRPAIAIDVRADLSTCCFVDRVSSIDRSLAPTGVDLIQAQLGLTPSQSLEGGVDRIEGALDVAMPGWRPQERWRRELAVDGASGAVDLPGTSWRDRPAIDRGDGRFLAGDMVAAPGMLSEVSVNSAVRAAQLALEHRRQRAFAPGWPSAALEPTRRVELLAATMPAASLQHGTFDGELDDTWTLEPHAETEPYFRLLTRRFHSVAVGAASRPGRSGTDVRVVVGTRRSSKPWARWLLEHLARRELRRISSR